MVLQIGMMIYLGILSVLDYRKKEVKLVALLPGIIFIPMVLFVSTQVSLYERLYGMGIGAIMLLISYFTRQAIGLADSIIILWLGFMLGFTKCIQILLVAFMICSIFCMITLALHVIKRKQKIAFLPFLWTGCLLGFFL